MLPPAHTRPWGWPEAHDEHHTALSCTLSPNPGFFQPPANSSQNLGKGGEPSRRDPCVHGLHPPHTPGPTPGGAAPRGPDGPKFSHWAAHNTPHLVRHPPLPKAFTHHSFTSHSQAPLCATHDTSWSGGGSPSQSFRPAGETDTKQAQKEIITERLGRERTARRNIPRKSKAMNERRLGAGPSESSQARTPQG